MAIISAMRALARASCWARPWLEERRVTDESDKTPIATIVKRTSNEIVMISVNPFLYEEDFEKWLVIKGLAWVRAVLLMHLRSEHKKKV
jgi:hypothetical protein